MIRITPLRRAFIWLFLLLINGQLNAQECRLPDSTDWARSRRMSYGEVRKRLPPTHLVPYWIEGKPYLYYNANTDEGVRTYLVNMRTGHKELLVRDHVSLTDQYSQLTGKQVDPRDFNLYNVEFRGRTMERFVWTKGDDTFEYNRRTGRLKRVLGEENKERGRQRTSFHTSEDGRYRITGCGYNLVLHDEQTGESRRLTDDGSPRRPYAYYNGEADSLETAPRGFWQGHSYIALLHNDTEVKEMGLISSLTKPRPLVHTFKMPMPGDVGVAHEEIYVYNADKDEGGIVDLRKYPDQEIELGYYRNEREIYVLVISRPGDQLSLCRIDLDTRAVQEVISEKCMPHYNMTLFNYRVIDEGQKILWWSERSGYGQYYMYDREGRLLHQVSHDTGTRRMVAGQVVQIDPQGEWMIFEGYGGVPEVHPAYAYYYWVSLDGSKQRLLTPGEGDHELTISSDLKYALDRYSRMDLPPVYSAIDLSGKRPPIEIGRVSPDVCQQAGWRAASIERVTATDGVTDLWGIVYTPSNLDPTKKYPVVSYVYPGPQTDLLPLNFSPDDNGNQALAELGFVVVQIPPRGSTPYRGRDFYNYGYGNLRDYPLADSKSALEQLAARYPYMDLDRVGIYGHSGGAFQTVTSMLTYPHFYKVGVAASGNYDNSIYIQWWGEKFHGVHLKADSTPEAPRWECCIPTPMELTDQLRGKLLLMTGDQDKNVPPSNTYRLVHALMESGKMFDFMIFPGKDHELDSPYYFALIQNYFVEHLISPTDKRIDIYSH